jgi:hypothetical protein
VNHDALFKKLLKRPAIFKGFFNAFLPDVAAFVDFSSLEYVDKEGVTLDGRKRTGDLLVKTRFRGESAAFLIHLEHQAQPDSDLARRMLEYWLMDWRNYDLPVYPIAVLNHQRPAPNSACPLEINFPNKRILEFDFDVIDLFRMNAESYVQMQNPAALALASRMQRKSKERVGLTLDFFLNLAKTPINKKDKAFIAGFFSGYQPLNPGEALQLEMERDKVEPDTAREAVMNLTNPFIELGKQRGLEQGRYQGEADLVMKQLSRRLGTLSSAQEKAIRKLPLHKIEALGEALLDFTSPADLAQWLRNNKKSGT